jgi:hypothetical protein
VNSNHNNNNNNSEQSVCSDDVGKNPSCHQIFRQMTRSFSLAYLPSSVYT